MVAPAVPDPRSDLQGGEPFLDQPSFLVPCDDAARVLRVGRHGDGKQELSVDLDQPEEEQRLITGIHEVCGEMCRQPGPDGLLRRSRYRASHDALFHVVMARIANPDSKRGSVRRLEEDFDVSLPLEKVCRMMDQIDAKTIDRLRPREGEARRSLLPEPVAVLFFDCTSLSRAPCRRHLTAGASPARQLSLQPAAIGAGDGGNRSG